MDELGRITLPKVIRDQIGLYPGAPLLVSLERGTILIEIASSQGRRLMYSSDGRPYFEAVPGISVNDEDVQRLRYRDSW